MKKKLIYFFPLLIGFLLGLIGNADADTLYESYTPSTPSYRGESANSSQYRGQAVLITSDHTITSVILSGGRDGTGGNVTLTVWSSTTDSHTLLGTSDTYDCSGCPNYPSIGEQTFLFSTPVSVNSGDYIYIAIHSLSGTYYVGGDDPGSYSDGTFIYSNDGGTSWAQGDGDVWFEIYGSSGESPPVLAEVNNTLVLALAAAGLFVILLFDLLRRHFIMN